MAEEKRPRINDEIRSPEIRVIDQQGVQLGIMSPKEALRLAMERAADLVEIVPNAKPPVCRIISLGKFKYEQAKKDKFQRKHQHVSVLKELRFHPNTDTHDFDFKVRHARKFLLDGNKVKATVVFKGREITRIGLGEELLTRFAEQLTEMSRIDQPPKMEGRSMVLLLVPDRKKKTEAKNAERKSTEEKPSKPKKEVDPHAQDENA